MTPWTGWLEQFAVRPSPPPRGIDLGNGRMLGAEDVLEGHYRHMAARPARRNVPVQVGDHLLAAITVLAPDLAPLTLVAEEVADAMPHVQPAPDFRRHLHQALERTHRQHAAQRTLGTRSSTPPPSAALLPSKVAALLTLLLLLVVAWRWWNHRGQASAPA